MTFNRQLMMLAREFRELTQSELADAMGVAQGTVSKVENGIRDPDEEFVRRLAVTTNFREEFFSSTDEVYGVGLTAFHFRRRKKLSAKKLGQINAETNLRRIHIRRLLIGPESLSKCRIPEIDRDEFVGPSRKPFSVEAVADLVRDSWGIGPGPVPDLIGAIESAGGIVVPCDFGTDLVDAISYRFDGVPPLLFYNSGMSADRQRFTIAHELGHIILHSIPDQLPESIEEEADRFAAAFLLPEREFRARFRTLDQRQLALLKQYWRVSMAAIVYRASSLGLISNYQFKHYNIESRKNGTWRREPVEIAQEQPRALGRIVRFHQDRLQYSAEDLSALVGLSPEEFLRLYGAAESALTADQREKADRKPVLTIVK